MTRLLKVEAAYRNSSDTLGTVKQTPSGGWTFSETDTLVKAALGAVNTASNGISITNDEIDDILDVAYIYSTPYEGLLVNVCNQHVVDAYTLAGSGGELEDTWETVDVGSTTYSVYTGVSPGGNGDVRVGMVLLASSGTPDIMDNGPGDSRTDTPDVESGAGNISLWVTIPVGQPPPYGFGASGGSPSYPEFGNITAHTNLTLESKPAWMPTNIWNSRIRYSCNQGQLIQVTFADPTGGVSPLENRVEGFPNNVFSIRTSPGTNTKIASATVNFPATLSLVNTIEGNDGAQKVRTIQIQVNPT